MSIKVIIRSREEAEFLLRGDTSKYTHLISIFGADEERVPGFKKIPHALALCFDDVSYPEAAIRNGYVPPDRGHIERIINFARVAKRDYNDTPVPPKDVVLLVHCAAGISRSSAAAYIFLLTFLGIDREQEAYAMVMQERPQASPNPLMLSLANEVLGIDRLRREAWIAAISPYDID